MPGGQIAEGTWVAISRHWKSHHSIRRCGTAPRRSRSTAVPMPLGAFPGMAPTNPRRGGSTGNLEIAPSGVPNGGATPILLLPARRSAFGSGRWHIKTFWVQIHKTKQTRHRRTLFLGIATFTDIHESINTIPTGANAQSRNYERFRKDSLYINGQRASYRWDAAFDRSRVPPSGQYARGFVFSLRCAQPDRSSGAGKHNFHRRPTPRRVIQLPAA
jgi:hypothetical protein